MKKSPFIFSSALSWLLIAVVGLFSLSSCKKDNNNSSTAATGTIAQIVSGSPNFTILYAAVVKANLGSTLNGTGPFTVFAPSDSAFMASGITMNTLNSLTADQIKSILLYHTLPILVKAANVPAGPNAAVVTAGGDSVYVTNNSRGVFVDGVKVITADVPASNGVIHVIGSVLNPPAGNIVQVAQADTSFSYLVAAVLRASQGNTNVAQVLSGAGPYTVFAPVNNAFRAAGFPTINDINNADPNVLASILTYHVIAGRVFSSDLVNGAQVTTLNGAPLSISLTSGAMVKGMGNTTAADIIATNIMATNGVVHVIDQVLLPQ